MATAIHPQIGRSDHAVVTACFTSAAPHINQPTARKVWRYSSANWGRLRHFFGTTDWSAVINDIQNHAGLNITQRIIMGEEKFNPSNILTTLLSDPRGGHKRACKQWRPRTRAGRPGEMISIIISSGSSQLRPSNMLSESLVSHGWPWSATYLVNRLPIRPESAGSRWWSAFSCISCSCRRATRQHFGPYSIFTVHQRCRMLYLYRHTTCH